jgi:hypothetical protein
MSDDRELSRVAQSGPSLADRAKVENHRRQHLHNPFLVLELPPAADGTQIERQGQKLLGMLAAQLAGADSYATPLGPCPRTPELVRAAMAELLDPDRRLLAEWWLRGWKAGS